MNLAGSHWSQFRALEVLVVCRVALWAWNCFPYGIAPSPVSKDSITQVQHCISYPSSLSTKTLPFVFLLQHVAPFDGRHVDSSRSHFLI